MSSYAAELDVAQRLAREAGALLLVYRTAGLSVEHKTGADDPVTEADRAASELILHGLRAAFPADGLLSEESPDDLARLQHQRVWSIDPIDGTKEFISGSPDFCVSIGLSVGGEAVLGVVYVPVTDELISGVVGEGVLKNGVPVQVADRESFVVSVSGSEYRRELRTSGLPGLAPSGSIALKLARIAAGEADATFCISPRNEWDIAAGHALLRAAGGELWRRDGGAIRYNQPRPHIEQGLIGGQPQAVAWLKAELLARAVPVVHLGVQPADPAWQVLVSSGALEQQVWVQYPQSCICIRYSAQQLLALLAIDLNRGTVWQATGDGFHLARLVADAVRAGLLEAHQAALEAER